MNGPLQAVLPATLALRVPELLCCELSTCSLAPEPAVTEPVVALVLELVTPELMLPLLLWLLARLLGSEYALDEDDPLALLELLALLAGKLLVALLASALDVVAPVLLTDGDELVAVVALLPVLPTVDDDTVQLYCRWM